MHYKVSVSLISPARVAAVPQETEVEGGRHEAEKIAAEVMAWHAAGEGSQVGIYRVDAAGEPHLCELWRRSERGWERIASDPN